MTYNKTYNNAGIPPSMESFRKIEISPSVATLISYGGIIPVESYLQQAGAIHYTLGASSSDKRIDLTPCGVLRTLEPNTKGNTSKRSDSSFNSIISILRTKTEEVKNRDDFRSCTGGICIDCDLPACEYDPGE